MLKAATPMTTSGSTTDFKIDESVLKRIDMIPKYVEAVNSGDAVQELDAVRELRKLLSIERNPPIENVVHSGVVPKFVEMLTSRKDNPSLLFEVVWCLTNIASGRSDQTQAIIDSGAVPHLVALLSHEAEDVKEQAVWAIGNIAGDSPKQRDLVLKLGALKHILALCEASAKLTILRNATWTLSNLVRGKPQPDFSKTKQALPVLAKLIYSSDDEVLTDACWALSYLSDDTGAQNEKINAVIQSGVCRRLVELLLHMNPSVQTPALRTLGNIVTGDDVATQTVLNCGLLKALLPMFSHSKKGIRKEACWTVSNITAGNREQIQLVIDAGIFPILVKMLTAEEFDIGKEAAWAVSNATSGGSYEQIGSLVQVDAIPALVELTSCNDAKVTEVCLEGLSNILKAGENDRQTRGDTVNLYARQMEECGLVEKLEQLQHHGNIEVYKKACDMLESHFGDVHDEIQGELGSPGAATTSKKMDTSGAFTTSSTCSKVPSDAMETDETQPGEVDYAPGENE